MFLVDSHVVLWMVDDDPKLSPSVREQLAQDTTFVSAITVLELAIKSMNGHIVVPEEPEVLIEQQGLQSLPFSPEHAAAIHRFPQLARHDPFDRALLAQALVERLTFVTVDRRLRALGHDWILDPTA